MDLGLGAHIDPASGFVENEEAGVVGQPLAQHDLLLVPAGKRRGGHLRTGGPDIQSLHLLGGALRLAPGADEDVPDELRQNGHAQVFPDRHGQHEALVLPVLGHEGDAGIHRSPDRSHRQWLAGEGNGPAVVCVDAEDGPGHFGATRPHEAANAENLARMQVEGDA